MKNIEKRYQCSFHGFKEKSNSKKTTWLLNILAIAKRTPHPPISDDVLIEGGIFPTHFFGQKHSIFGPKPGTKCWHFLTLRSGSLMRSAS